MNRVEANTNSDRSNYTFSKLQIPSVQNKTNSSKTQLIRAHSGSLDGYKLIQVFTQNHEYAFFNFNIT